jgi:hypothetical protein
MNTSVHLADRFTRNCITVNGSYRPVVTFNHLAGNILLLIYRLIKDYLAEFKFVLKMNTNLHLADRFTRNCITVNGSYRPVVTFNPLAGNILLLIYRLIKDYLAEFKFVLKTNTSVHLADRFTRNCITVNGSYRPVVTFNHLVGNILLLIYRLIQTYLAEFKCDLIKKSSIDMTSRNSRNCTTFIAFLRLVKGIYFLKFLTTLSFC